MAKTKELNIVKKKQILTTYTNYKADPYIKLDRKRWLLFSGASLLLTISAGVLVYIILALTGVINNDFIWKVLQ